MASKAPDTNSELAQHLSEAGIDAEYWTGILKAKLEITLLPQLQYLDETHLKVLKEYIRHGWEEKALRKLLGITSEPTSNQAAKDGKSDVVDTLTEAGLDGKFWSDVSKTKLGITRMEQIKYLNIENLKRLLDSVRYEWEETALRNVFGISEKAHEDYLDKHQKQHEQKIEDAIKQYRQKLEDSKKLLGDVIKLKKNNIEHTDEMINSKLDQLRQLINISKEQWVKKYDDKSLDDMISKMNSDLQDLDKLAENRQEYSASEILANASAGLALRGIPVGKALSDDCEKRIVLSAPTDLTLMNPVMLQVDNVEHFSSKEQSDQFHRSLTTMGYSVAASVKGGFGLFTAEAKFSKKHETEDEKESESHKHNYFESRVIYSVVPTAACEFNLHSLKLSQQALHELKAIDRLLVGSNSPELAYKSCEEFIMSYGSHINVGVLHFGGVNTFVATYSSETKSNANQTKAMLRDALSMYASASYSGIGFGVGGSVSADNMESHGSFNSNYEEEEMAKTSLHTIRIGGPQEVNALPLWKMGLVAFNSTWNLIDRGKSLSEDFVGIWKLIPNHKDDFQKPYELESSLKTVWEKINGIIGSSDQEQTLIKGLDAMHMLIGKIATWNSQPLLPERCIGYLQEVLETVEQAEGTINYWEDKFCTEEDISRFLGNVVELKSQFNPKDVPMIRFLITKLVKPVGFREFPGKQAIMNWGITRTVDIPSILAGVKNIPDLIRNVKERFVPTLQIEHANNTAGSVEVRDSINAGATVDLAICICQLRKDLQSSGESHKMFFLNVSLLPLHYHWPTEKFETLLTMDKLQNFVQNIEVLWKEFLAQKVNGIIQLEAFLINTLLTSDHLDTRKQSSEDEFSEITKDLRQVVSPQLNKVINRCATRAPFNWGELTSITGELAKGNMSVAEEKVVDLGDLQNVFASHDRQTKEKGPIQTCKAGVKAQGAFLDVLKTLGLDKYYPSKLSLLDAMVIKKVIGHPTLVDLPWMIIHRLLMIDFHARDHLITVVTNSEEREIHDGGDDFSVDDFLLETQSSSDSENNATHLNTLDVLVAIFACCDNILKQTLAQKLFVCKLAIPFLYSIGSADNIVMSLWALRTITLQWHNKYKEATETPVTERPFPLITFVRLGRPPLSKSKLINDILRDASHDTFFNHDCNNGTVDRRLTDGLVECSWFITANKEKEHLPCTSTLLNLRGDASSLKKQMQILQEISSVLFVIVTAHDLARTPHTNTCREILRTDAKVILFVISGHSNQSRQELVVERQACVEAVGKDFLKGIRIISSSDRHGVKKNASDLKTDARINLSEAIAGCSGMVMEECARIAEKRGIIIDEYDDEACVEGKVLANNVLSHIKGKEIVDCKGPMLPLQGAEWIEYCKLLKKQHRASGKASQTSSAYEADQIKQKMIILREKQVQICNNGLDPFIKDFMSTLQKTTDVALYFLKWMNIFLDKKSRANLPVLRNHYHTLWTQFQEAKKKEQKAKMQNLKSKVDDAEHQFVSASLGLENLFRELGQIYEAVQGSGKTGKDTREVVEYLPKIAAELLMKGSPLELVDGDASSVPISWVSAVLSKLGNIIGEKRLFVISVLGIQGSGKSTLLNTMFGLQFAVSAGRCTKGAYMQLIRVDDNAQLPFDYMVVVDTEGLRAPELERLTHEHDNELATLVIGMGDVTLINIKGENTAELKDILQIVVHAFLRMNRVKKNIKDHRTCIFVHQNVPAADAETQMMHGCQKLQDGLDDMAKEAAQSENIANIHSFSQIIHFDVQKHVWYCSDLWQGNPPMAPANPGYSEKVDEIRSSLLGDRGQTTFLTASDLSIRINDLWTGILADDFVFSFRNSLEMKAYNSLQSQYYTLEWDLQNSVKYWLDDAEIKLQMCETIEDLELSFQSLIVELSKVLDETAEETKNGLTNYFETSNLLDIIIQWQQSKLNQLSFSVEQQHNDGKTDLLSIKEARRVEILQRQKGSQHEVDIMNKAVELADKLKGQEVTDAELEKTFDAMWMSIVHELTTKSKDEKLRMDEEMEKILNTRLHAHGNLLRDELRHLPLKIPLKQRSLEESITVGDVDKKHISLKKTRLFQGKLFSSGPSNSERVLQARHTTVALTGSILNEINTYLIDLSKKGTKFKKTHAIEVVKNLVEKIDTHNQEANESEENCTFTILPIYTVKLAVHVSRHCVQVFSLIQLEYNKKHGVQAKLEGFKNNAWSLFKNMVKQSTEEVMAGDLLCAQLKGIIQKAVKKKIPRKCIDEVIRDFQMTKYYLITMMLDDLARKENFKDYKSYISDAKGFTLSWITQYTNKKMFSKEKGSGMSRYAEITTSHIRKIVRCIVKSVEQATGEVEGQKGKRMPLWIENFCQRVKEEIAVPVSTLKHVDDRQVVDFSNLQRIILEQLEKMEASLVETFTNETTTSIDWDGTPPPQQILDKIWGCPEQCPFCMEPCADTTAGHYKSDKRNHMCVKHRPMGIGGVIHRKTGKLVHETCNYYVQNMNCSFNCGACRFKCREYGKCSTTGNNTVWHACILYKTFLQDWDIAPDPTNTASTYWRWFMTNYQGQLKDMYMHNSARLPDIPGAWESITMEEALNDLRKCDK